MLEITLAAGVGHALDELFGDRLALLCGAGLSMAEPSNLPGAAALARAAKTKYEAMYGPDRPPLPDEIDTQADYFFARGELATIYLRFLVNRDVFAGRPNAGHSAVADLLLTRGVRTAVSTNVDTLIETAGQHLLGQVSAGIDRDSMARLPPDRSPLLKIHGCWAIDLENTVWAPGQLDVDPVGTRIVSSAAWLEQRLLDCDLVIVGFWTDWDYLNDVLRRTLGQVRPARVIVVSPSDSAQFREKAPDLYTLGEHARISFHHVRESGDVFLTRLRLDFSRSFVRRILYAGRDVYRDEKGQLPDAQWVEPEEIDVDSLWSLRRDLEGRKPGEPASERVPCEEPMLGLTLLQLRAKGAVAEGQYWRLDSRSIRVIRAPNQALHSLEAAHVRETAPTAAPDIIICVGAERQAMPSNIVRQGTTATIARGTSGRWLTRPEAVEELNL